MSTAPQPVSNVANTIENTDPEVNFNLDERISWYHSPLDKAVMRRLMERSDYRGFRQVGLHLGLILLTGALCVWLCHTKHWLWLLPALYAHGTVYGFFSGGVAGHELSHRTVFKTRLWNEVFIWLSSIMGYGNHVWFRTSHVKHHQLTVWKDLDGEVVLPAKLEWKGVFWACTINFPGIYHTYKNNIRTALGIITSDWDKKIFPESNPGLRRQLANCARIVLTVQVALAVLFVLKGWWIMLVLVTFAPFYGSWLGLLVGFPQHAGLTPSVPDFRLCCRTYTTNPFFSFLYWQMNYHLEHHMYAAVPFWRLKDLRREIAHDLPPAHHGLIPTWREILTILKQQKADPTYTYRPPLPTKQG